MKNYLTILLLLMLCMSFSFVKGAETIPYKIISGKVVSGGKGIANIVVTDGFTCMQTNEEGEYSIKTQAQSQYIYISTPSGYLTENKDRTIPQFYKKIQEEQLEYIFELKKNKKDESKHIFIAQADVQLAGEDDLNDYKSIVADIKELAHSYENQEVFGIDCGDIIGDTPSLFESYINTVSEIGIPIYRAIGNHDMNYWGRTHETSSHTFEQYFGPTRYSFNKGSAHYIVINNNFFIGREYFYMGYVDEKTFLWLEEDLKYVDEGTPVFFVMHIPSRLQKEQKVFEYNLTAIAGQTVNVVPLYALLEKYNTHIISGHMHYNHNVVHSPKLMEHITGAVCGTWWQGDICLDGTPQGYGVYEVEGKDVKWYYKSSGFPKEHQFRAYSVGASKEHPDDVVVNVWNWDEAWKVEWLEDGESIGEMTHFTGYDPDAVILCSNREKLKYKWISIQATDHLFKATPKNKEAELSIKVTDRFGTVYHEKIN